MTAEIGQLALILAFVMALVQSLAPLLGAYWIDRSLMRLGRAAAVLQAVFVAAAFFILMGLFLANDFSVRLVAEHSNTTQPTVYRAAATWGSHEGSMLLWVLILSLHGGAVALFGRSLRETLQARVLAVQGLIASAFLGFSLFTSNPFARLDPAALDGAELNPLLQDPGLVGHPPLLYLGYVGFSAAFSFAIAALIEGRVDASWSRWVRPWILSAWICLTVGITLGSIWSYYTLGWGGWWFWDPVENASLMPWLMGTALLHSSIALERRGALASWTILLAIMTFSLSLIGTFLVRSGVLSSVHAFAVDERRGVYILAIIALATGSSLALFAWRASAMRSGALFAAVSREAGITLNNLFLFAAASTVFLGTFYPLFVEAYNGQKISVGPPFYHETFVPIFVPLLVLAVFGPMLHWKRDGLRALLRRLQGPAGITALFLFGGIFAFGFAHTLAAFGVALGVWLVSGAIALPLRRISVGQGLGASTRRLLVATPLTFWGLVVAHAGLGITTLGITAVSTWQSDLVRNMAVGDTAMVAGRTITLTALQDIDGPNYQASQAFFSVRSGGSERVLVSQHRFYPASQSDKTEAGIGVGLFANIYIAMGTPNGDGSVVVRMWVHPLVNWIWAGAFMMAFGGFLSLLDRRARVPVAVRQQVTLAGAPA
ncbi:MAG TPA: heme lyase CcmF/NrfE family subunit [Rhizomicrobium sp.]|jgi:cytochrome c-type biogenesis protein CcmF